MPYVANIDGISIAQSCSHKSIQGEHPLRHLHTHPNPHNAHINASQSGSSSQAELSPEGRVRMESV